MFGIAKFAVHHAENREISWIPQNTANIFIYREKSRICFEIAKFRDVFIIISSVNCYKNRPADVIKFRPVILKLDEMYKVQLPFQLI